LKISGYLELQFELASQGRKIHANLPGYLKILGNL
jgi:hypothetical protein